MLLKARFHRYQKLSLMKIFKNFSLLAIFLFCFDLHSQSPQYSLTNFSKAPQMLSEFGFFKDMKNQIPTDSVHPYSLVSQLFSDETDKLRFVYVPEGKKIGYEKNKVL